MTIITLKVDERSEETLRRYINENGIRNGKEKFHSTLIYTEEHPIFQRFYFFDRLRAQLPLSLNPNTYSFDIFDPMCLVLRYENKDVEALRRAIQEEGLRQSLTEWPDLDEEDFKILRNHARIRKSRIYEMGFHVTIANPFNGSLEGLPILTEPISFSEFDWYHQ